jgi:hypothetical protein
MDTLYDKLFLKHTVMLLFIKIPTQSMLLLLDAQIIRHLRREHDLKLTMGPRVKLLGNGRIKLELGY